jgi:hypothetical protein
MLNLTFYYNSTARAYSVSDADKIGGSLFTEKTLQNAYDKAIDECERRGVEMGEWTSIGFDPAEWDGVNK